MVADFVDALVTQETGTGTAVLRLLGGPPRLAYGSLPLDLPADSARLLAIVALAGRIDRAHAARTARDGLTSTGVDLLRDEAGTLVPTGNLLVDVDVVHAWADRVIGWRPRAEDLATAPDGMHRFELLPGWRDGWLASHRERLRQWVLPALESLSRQLVQADRSAEAVEMAAAVVAADPHRRSARRALLEAYTAQGDWVQSYRVLGAYRDLVRRELGTPVPDLGRC